MNKYLTLLILSCLSILTVGILAQPGVATCDPLIQQALIQLGDNCDELSRNNACYGYTLVQAALSSEAPEVEFNQPRDRAGLADVLSLRTSALSESEETWGIAMLNTQANLPNTLPGQGVIMMLLGDASLVNQVDATTLPTITPVQAQVTSNTEGVRVRTGAGLNFNIIDVIPPGGEITVEGRSEDGLWLRVVADDQAGWMFTNLIDTAVDVESLPVLEDVIQSPMQAFYFRSGVGNGDCATAPNSLMIQSPTGPPVELTVNESSIVITSTVVIETINDETMILYVIDGQAVVNNLIVPQGWKAFVPIELRDDLLRTLEDEETTIIQVVGDEGIPAVTGPWETCDVITDEDRVWLDTLSEIDPDLLHYEIPNAPTVTSLCRPPQPIRVQQEIECGGFVGTSPTDGMQWGTQRFYWDPAPGATSYRVNVYDEFGNLVGTAETTDLNVEVDTGADDRVGGVSYTWEVEAINSEGNAECETNSITLPRGAQPTPEPDEPNNDGPKPDASEETKEEEPESEPEPEEPVCPPEC